MNQQMPSSTFKYRLLEEGRSTGFQPTENKSEYRGDTLFYIDAYNDLVVGDTIRFIKAIYKKKTNKKRFSFVEEKLLEGEITKEFYCKKIRSFGFQFLDTNGKYKNHSERILFKISIFRKQWEDESLRIPIAAESKARRAEMYESFKNYVKPIKKPKKTEAKIIKKKSYKIIEDQHILQGIVDGSIPAFGIHKISPANKGYRSKLDKKIKLRRQPRKH